LQQQQPDNRRIAVLPLANMSQDARDEVFPDGMTEELISALSKIAGLRVIARTSVMRYKDTKKPTGEISKELNVSAILEGSVRRAGNKIRIGKHTSDPLLSSNDSDYEGRFEKIVGERLDTLSLLSRLVSECPNLTTLMPE
jgi:hypothetical protein